MEVFEDVCVYFGWDWVVGVVDDEDGLVIEFVYCDVDVVVGVVVFMCIF